MLTALEYSLGFRRHKCDCTVRCGMYPCLLFGSFPESALHGRSHPTIASIEVLGRTPGKPRRHILSWGQVTLTCEEMDSTSTTPIVSISTTLIQRNHTSFSILSDDLPAHWSTDTFSRRGSCSHLLTGAGLS